ncbi:MAG: type II secretion system F family protein [Desulfobacterales bacterium]|nr:type II secretion system F family protein [Desulfobacterales bacterium]
MPKYIYQAFNELGDTVSDTLDVESADAVSSILAARGLVPTRIAEARSAQGAFNFSRLMERLSPIRAPELILFTKQFRTMLRAGVPIVRLLQILGNQSENASMKRVIAAMSKDISDGASLHKAFSRHPGTFSPLYCGMVQAGEASGALPDVLDRLTYIVEHENKIRSDIRAAMQYPLIVVFFLLIAFVVLLTFVMPKFVNIFLGAGLTLPLPTKICMIIYRFMGDYWFVLIGAGVAGFLALNTYLRTDRGQYVRDSLLLKLPVLGPMFIKAAMSRFASIFSILQASGVAVMESMKILSGTVGNLAIAKEFERINEMLEEGRGIAQPLHSAKYFTPMVTNMVAIGEESGELQTMLAEISGHYDVELEYAMKKLSDGIGPMLTVGLAAVVGFFALAIFLPMWDMIGVIK